MQYFFNFIKSRMFIRCLTLVGLVGFVYLSRSLFSLFLFTFIFIYISNKCDRFVRSKFPKMTNLGALLFQITFFVVLITFLSLFIANYFPIIATQFTQVLQQLTILYKTPTDSEFVNYVKDIFGKGYTALVSYEGVGYITKTLSNISKIGVNLLLAMVLSLSFTLGKNSTEKFLRLLKNSKLSPIYNEVAFLGAKFLVSFGKVIEVQMIIAFVNGLLSVICLSLIRFPNILGFGIMIFVLGLIPVAGVIISLIPLGIMAYYTGGFPYLLYVFIMIIVIHAFESYVLNPKLMSSKTKLPIFFTFVVLIVSEHFLGVWGLIIGVPIVVFILELFDVQLGE